MIQQGSDLHARRWTVEFLALAFIAASLGSSWLAVWRNRLVPQHQQEQAAQNVTQLTGVVRSEPVTTRIEVAVGGRIAQIEVEEGARVSAGDVLFRLDPQEHLRELEDLRMQLALLYVQKAAVSAEQDSSRTISVDDLELAELSAAPAATEALADLIQAHEEALTERAVLASMRSEAVARQIERIARKKELHKLMRDKSEEQFKSIHAEKMRIADMVKRGTFPLNRAADIERQGIAAELRMAESDAALAESDSELDSLKIAAAEQRRTRWDELFEREQDTVVKIAGVKHKIDSTQRLIAGADIKAPHDGTVRNLRLAHAGLDLGARELVMELSKDDQAFLVEAVAPPDDALAISTGGAAQVRVSGTSTGTALTSLPAMVDGLMAQEEEADGKLQRPGRQSVYLSINEVDVPTALRHKLRTGYSVSIVLPRSARGERAFRPSALEEPPAAAPAGPDSS